MHPLQKFIASQYIRRTLIGALSFIILSASLGARPVHARLISPSAILDGVGIMGDSNLDEYQGDDHRGGIYHSRTFNMIELLARLRGFNLGDWGTYPEPRRTGYEYNWARSGATSTTLITQGQHIGLAAQVAAGEVTFVMLHIGSNDFSPYVGNAYQEACYLSDEQFQEKVDNAIANVTLATDTILDADPEGMIVTLFPQWDGDPIIEGLCPEPERRQRIHDGIETINQAITDLAETRPIVVENPLDVIMAIYLRLEDGYLNVGGELIDFLHKGDEPHHAQLNDVSGHAGTVLSGLLANGLWIDPINQYYGTQIKPLSDNEILQAAGIIIIDKPFIMYVPILPIK